MSDFNNFNSQNLDDLEHPDLTFTAILEATNLKPKNQNARPKKKVPRKTTRAKRGKKDSPFVQLLRQFAEFDDLRIRMSRYND